MEYKPSKVYTKSQVLKKAAYYCAYQERCQQDLRNKLYQWGLHSQDVEELITLLIEDNFINEERFAKAFSSGKFHILKWGKVKIKNELKQRNISEYCICKGLEEIGNTEYQKTLKNIITKKLKEIKGKNKFQIMNKVASFAISKGYESELVFEIMKSDFEI